MTRALTGLAAVRPQMDLAGLFARNRALYGDTRMQDPPAPAPPVPAPTDRTFSQAELTAIATREKAEGEKAALAKFAEQLGMSPEEAKKKLDAATAAERAAMDEATRKAAEAADAKSAADRDAATAAQATLEAKVTQQLLVTGLALGDKDDERAEKVAMAVRLVNVPAGADDAAIKAAVDRVKTMVPQLFTATTTAAGGGQGDPGPGPAGHQQQAGAFGKGGDEEYAKRFPAKAGAST